MSRKKEKYRWIDRERERERECVCVLERERERERYWHLYSLIYRFHLFKEAGAIIPLVRLGDLKRYMI